MVTNAIIFGILLGVSLLGYVFRAGLFLMLAGLGMVVFGISLWTLYEWLSIVVAVVGVVLFYVGAKS